MVEYKIGDRVKCVKEYCSYGIKDMKGTIVNIQSNDSIGISWDTFTKGHTCDGTCDEPKGLYVTRVTIEPLKVNNGNYKQY